MPCSESLLGRRQRASLHPDLRGREAGEIIGRSPSFRALRADLERVAPTDTTVLLSGETGTGKDVTARAIHRLSMRARGPFVPVDCGALPDDLIDSELFGHRRGAFTGAVSERRGKIASASGGTLFLDGLDHLSPGGQTRLLRALQEREVQPLGEERARPVDFRLLVSVSEALTARLERGEFRPDLYYRVRVVELALPPLRERRDDIPLLAECFLRDVSRRFGKPLARLEARALDVLIAYDWPGNVRELESVIECAAATSRGEIVRESDLPVFVRQPAVARPEPLEPARGEAREPDREETRPFAEQVEAFQRELLTRTLSRCDWSHAACGDRLGLSRHQVKYLCGKLGIRRPRL